MQRQEHGEHARAVVADELRSLPVCELAHIYRDNRPVMLQLEQQARRRLAR